MGDGPQMSELRNFIEREDLADGITLHGWVEHEQVNDILAECQIFAFPSVREFGGGVVLEAMAKGLVPIIVDYGGPAELVPDGTGVRIPLADATKIEQDLRSWLEEFQQNIGRLDSMRKAAQAYVYRHFTWEAKAAQILEIYHWVLGRRPDKPDFGTPLAANDSTP